jgi:PAS domain S-box-containing protein
MADYDNHKENNNELARLRARVEELEGVERLRTQSEAQLRAIIDNIPFSLSLKDASQRYLMVNQSFLDSTGLSAENIAGKQTESIFWGDVAESLAEGDQEVLEKGTTITRETAMGVAVRSPGIRQVTKFPVTNASGAVDGIVTVSIDITDRKKAEQNLRRSEERFRDFAEASSDVLWELDADLRHSYLSDRYYELTGKTSGQLAGQTRDETPPEIQVEGWEDHLRTLHDHLPFRDYVFPRAAEDGRTVWFSSCGVPVFDDDGEFEGYRGTLKDITAEIEAQQALRGSERLLKAIVDYAPLVINLKDLDGRFILANTAFLNTQLIAGNDVIGCTSHDFMPKNTADEVTRQDREVIKTGKVVDIELTFSRPNGDIATRSTLKFPVKNESGEIIAVGGFSLDITERKAAEEALRGSEERFRAIVDNSPAAIFLKDVDGRFQLANKQHNSWFGVEPGSRIGKTAYDLLSTHDADEVTKRERRVIEEDISLEWERDHILSDGQEHRLTTIKFPVYDGDGATIGVGSIQTDVTEERHMQDQLRQAQKMEAVGQLTGGIAHEFNNLLMVIVGNLEMILESPVDDSTRKFVNSAMSGAMRGSELTRQLLAFSRKQELKTARVQSDELVAGMRDMLQRTLGETIAIETVTETGAEPAIWPVMADAGQIEGALLNLALNAADAMPQGGTITFTASNQVLGARSLVKHPGLLPGDFVKLDVTDTGCGMPPEVLDRVFEPFFTTKDVGEGTGLGLSMVLGFVEQSGGCMEVHSETGQGTSISIYLPRTGDDAPQARPGEDHAAVKATTGATVLIVEDDPGVRELVVMMLSQLGHKTIEAEDAVAALARLEEHPHVDVLFTDVVLPGGASGVDLVERARTKWPDLKIIYTSGYPDGELPQLSSGNDASFIRKPYRKGELAQIFEGLLER